MKKKKTFLPVLQLTHMLRYIPGLMDKGSPVSVLFTGEIGSDSPLLYCEIYRKRDTESHFNL
jgi:hypothetical protein